MTGRGGSGHDGGGPVGGARLLVDGHVHFHPGFTWEIFLTAAAGHFAAGRREVGLGEEGPGSLLFTESAGVHAFRDLRDGRGRIPGGWELAPTGEDAAVRVAGPAGQMLLLVAGRQIVTAEKLEVLALGWDGEFPDGQPIREVLARVVDAGAVPVVPWGFGKWWFRRGRLLRALIEGGVPYRFFLGDNGGRPRLSREPRLFDAARAHGTQVLPGSDPLPFPDQARRAGSYGFVLPVALSPDRPATAIREALVGLSEPPRTFGRRERLDRFIRNQVRMQRAKWGRSRG
jgi:hypothetical protein